MSPRTTLHRPFPLEKCRFLQPTADASWLHGSVLITVYLEYQPLKSLCVAALCPAQPGVEAGDEVGGEEEQAPANLERVRRMGTLADAKDMATGDQRCKEAIMGAAEAQEPAVGTAPDHRVNIDELLALLDPSKPKASAHVVFIKAEYTPMVPAISEGVRATVDKAGYFAIAKALLDVSARRALPLRVCLRACARMSVSVHQPARNLDAGSHRQKRLRARAGHRQSAERGARHRARRRGAGGARCRG